MIYFFIFALALALYFSVCVRVVVFNPIKTIKYAVKDIYSYFKYMKWNNAKYGKIICFVGLFGKGKTLSAVHEVNKLYKKYNNKRVYDFDRKTWVTQKIHIISNVELNIPYEKFISLSQFLTVADNMKKKDIENNTHTVTYFLGDEFSVQLNSRQFKSNIDPLFLNTLLTCRHHHISLIYTAQRFNHVDALLRQVTSYVVDCNKCWRIMVHADFDAYELENATNTTLVKPLSRYGWFICDSDFKAYDTKACVGNLAKSCKDGDMLTEEEILNLQCNQGSNMEVVTTPSRKFIKTQKKQNK